MFPTHSSLRCDSHNGVCHTEAVALFLQENTVTWDGELSAAAQTILHQHAIQGDLTQLQQAMCRWMAVSRTHTSRPLDPRVLHRYLLALHDLWDTETLSKEEVRESLTNCPECVGSDVLQ